MKAAVDFDLTIDSVKYPFVLAEDERGFKQFGDGLAPMVAQQIRTTSVGYEHVPPEIEVVSAVENYRGGAGFETNPDGVPGRYAFSRGIDLSSERTAFIALKQNSTLESDSTAIGSAPVKFLNTTLGLFMLAGTYIYKWDLSSTSWVQKDSASGAAYTDLIELDGVLYAARGNATIYKYSTDGETWTAFTDTGTEYADAFTIRGNGSDVAALWKLNKNIIKVTTDGKNSGVAWAGGDEVGHTTETTRSLLTVDNSLFAFKKEGIYEYDGANTLDVWKSQYADAQNGKGAYLASNGMVYVTYGRRLVQFNPYYGVSGDAPIEAVFPTRGMDSLEVIGLPTAVAGDDNVIYMAVQNGAGRTYILAGHVDPQLGWVWHTKFYLSTATCNAISVIPAGVMHATRPCLVFGYDTAARYVVLPKQDLFPFEDTTCRYEVSEGSAYFPYDAFGVKTFPKFLNRGAVLGSGLSGGRYATLKYETDRSGSETTLASAVGDSLTEANESAEVSFHQVRQVLYMGTGDETVTPRVEGTVLGATLNPPRKRVWAPVILLGDGIEFDEGVLDESTPSAAVMRQILFGAVQKRITMTDRRNESTYTVRLLDIQPMQAKDQRLGDSERETSVYQLSLAEVKALTSTETVAIYDESDYDTNGVYGAS